MGARFEVEISPEAHRWLSEIKDKKVLSEIYKVMEGLSENPSGQGKALERALSGYRSIPAWNMVYRILYRIEDADEIVSIVVVGKRLPGMSDDIYAAAERLVKSLRR